MKVLVISHNSFSDVLNNGKTFESFFKDISKENLSQIFFCTNENPDFNYCTNYFRITDTDVLKRLLTFSSCCGKKVSIQDFQSSTSSPVTHNKWYVILKNKAEYLTTLRDLLWNFNTWNTKTLRDWCEESNPDIVFYVGGNFGFSHKVARYLSKFLNKPLVTYFTDDYVIFPKNRNILDVIQRYRMRKFYRKTIKRSSLCFAIGDLMCAEYCIYFKKDFFPLINSVDKHSYIPYIEKDVVNISYFGGLHLNRWKMLVRLAMATQNAVINVYSMGKLSVEIESEFKRVGVHFHGGVTGNALQAAILDSDILLHVESDDDYNKSLTRLSVSTKIPEYLMSGRFVLGFGPPEVASMRLLSDNNVGIVIPSSTDNEELKTLLNNVLYNFDLRKETGLRGYNFAINKFDNNVIVRDFMNKLIMIK